MRNEHDETECPAFNCSRLGGELADVHVTFRVGEFSDGRSGALRVQTGFDCEDNQRCGVATTRGLSTGYEWSKCVHPNAPKR